jgi:hypothetical protein
VQVAGADVKQLPGKGAGVGRLELEQPLVLVHGDDLGREVGGEAGGVMGAPGYGTAEAGTGKNAPGAEGVGPFAWVRAPPPWLFRLGASRRSL